MGVVLPLSVGYENVASQKVEKMLQCYNSLEKKQVPLETLEPGKIRLYVCGMTVYDYCHIGHARSLIVFDTLVRYWRYRGFEVTYVRNITDIDDKIIKRAQENDEDVNALTARFIEAMHEDERALGILPPDHEPRATEYIAEIIALIEKIVANGKGYVADNGDVCFDIQSMPDYGKLSKRDLTKMQAGSRVAVEDGKRNPLDFVLWKQAKPGEPMWPSPWGQGRPGWHIECSAMSTTLLGQPFDIHGGGMDLKFPHHENEIAQSEAACGCAFARYWLHAGLLTINGEKMSKSLGNFHTIRDVLAEHHPEVVRYFMLSGSYRSPLNYSAKGMQQMQSGLLRLYKAMAGLPADVPAVTSSPFETRFQQVMDDDFNTPEAFAVMFDLAREVNRLRTEDSKAAAAHAALLRQMGSLLGVLMADPEKMVQGDTRELDTALVDQLVAERAAAREAKDWARADEIRDQLAQMQVVIEDGANGATWRREGGG